MEWQRDRFTITTDKERMDLNYIHAYLSVHSYWAFQIPFETVKKSIDGAECFGMFDGDRQIGFARVITDKATFGYLADVFIDETMRGMGLGKWLMKVIMDHPEFQGFRSWMLGTRDAHGLYEQFGFKALEDPTRIMRKPNRDVYKQPGNSSK